jgi:hypothetical protein
MTIPTPTSGTRKPRRPFLLSRYVPDEGCGACCRLCPKNGHRRMRSTTQPCSSPWTSYTNVCLSRPSLTWPMLSPCLDSSGHPFNKFVRANSNWKPSRYQSRSFYRRSMESIVLDGCCRLGPRKPSWFYPGV